MHRISKSYLPNTLDKSEFKHKKILFILLSCLKVFGQVNYNDFVNVKD